MVTNTQWEDPAEFRPTFSCKGPPKQTQDSKALPGQGDIDIYCTHMCITFTPHQRGLCFIAGWPSLSFPSLLSSLSYCLSQAAPRLSLSFQSETFVKHMEKAASPAGKLNPLHPFKGTRYFIITTGRLSPSHFPRILLALQE